MQQLTMFDARSITGSKCSDCICKSCLYWWSNRCPHGGCYDDLRAIKNPYDAAHQGKIRKEWSAWNSPGEQQHWCRGGDFHPQGVCKQYVEYTGQDIRECLLANVSVFQDGYIRCSLVENVGCEQCMKQFEEQQAESEGE